MNSNTLGRFLAILTMFSVAAVVAEQTPASAFWHETVPVLAQRGDVFSSNSSRPPRNRDTFNVNTAANPLWDCHHAVGNAVQAPWIIESAAKKCNDMRNSPVNFPAGFQGAVQECWGLLDAAIVEVRAANEQFQAAKRATAPHQGQLVREGNRHLANAKDILKRAEQCIKGTVEQFAEKTHTTPMPHGGAEKGATGGGGREDDWPQVAHTEPRLSDYEVDPVAAVKRLLGSIDAYWGPVFLSCGVAYRPPGLMVMRPSWEDKAVYEPYGRLSVPRHAWEKILVNRVRLFKNGENEAHAILAHEVGHRVQDLQNRMRGRLPVEVELEADMLLGVYAKWLKDEGRLPEGFFEAALSSRRNAPEDPAHGTPEQREAAVRHGYEHGLPEDFCSRAWAYRVPSSRETPGDASPASPPQTSCPPGMIPQQLGDFLWCRHPKGWTRQ